MNYYPIYIDVESKPCLVVGGGSVGQRKVEGLLEFGACVRLVSREVTPQLQALIDEKKVDYLGTDYEPGFLDGSTLVYVCTDDTELNTRVSKEAIARGIAVNVADVTELCSFIVPATVARGSLNISISTGGKSPALAAKIRRRLEDEFGPEYGRFLDLMGLIRPKVISEGKPSGDNKKTFVKLVESDMIDALAEDDAPKLERIMIKILGPSYTLKNLGYKL